MNADLNYTENCRICLELESSMVHISALQETAEMDGLLQYLDIQVCPVLNFYN